MLAPCPTAPRPFELLRGASLQVLVPFVLGIVFKLIRVVKVVVVPLVGGEGPFPVFALFLGEDPERVSRLAESVFHSADFIRC